MRAGAMAPGSLKSVVCFSCKCWPREMGSKKDSPAEHPSDQLLDHGDVFNERRGYKSVESRLLMRGMERAMEIQTVGLCHEGQLEDEVVVVRKGVDVRRPQLNVCT